MSDTTYDVQQALDEIMEISPIYRRDYIIDYLRKYLPENDARYYLFRKTKAEYIDKMIKDGYVTKRDLLERIGREKIEQYYHLLSTRS